MHAVNESQVLISGHGQGVRYHWIWRTGCISGEHEECDPSSSDTKRQQTLGTGPHTDWPVSTVGGISLCQRFGTRCQHSHSIKLQSVWLIVVSCALRQDHHWLFRPFTWCWTLITMKVKVMFICLDVYSWGRHGQKDKFDSGGIYGVTGLNGISVHIFNVPQLLKFLILKLP